MKLKCEAHDRRALVILRSKSIVHRTGDMSTCEGNKVYYKCETTPSLNKTWTVDEFMTQTHLQPSDPEADRLLQAIFGVFDHLKAQARADGH